jgi:hypothetical protein
MCSEVQTNTSGKDAISCPAEDLFLPAFSQFSAYFVLLGGSTTEASMIIVTTPLPNKRLHRVRNSKIRIMATMSNMRLTSTIEICYRLRANRSNQLLLHSPQ